MNNQQLANYIHRSLRGYTPVQQAVAIMQKPKLLRKLRRLPARARQSEMNLLPLLAHRPWQSVQVWPRGAVVPQFRGHVRYRGCHPLRWNLDVMEALYERM